MKVFIGQPGQSAEILTQKLLRKPLSKDKKEKKTLKDRFQRGIYKNQDLLDVSVGYSVLENVITQGLDITESSILTGEKDVGQFKLGLVSYKSFIEICLRRIDRYISAESNMKKELVELREHYRYAQAARDGILLKQATRKEKDPETGQIREITFDTSMTPYEVVTTLQDYEMLLKRMRMDKASNYIGLGTSFIGMLGMFSRLGEKDKNADTKKNLPIIPLGSLVTASLKLLQRFIPDKDLDEARRLWKLEKNLSYEFLENEQISDKAGDDVVLEIEDYAKRANALDNKKDNTRFAVDAGLSIIVSLIVGMYVRNQVQMNGNKKFNGKDIATTLVSIGETKSFVSHATRIIEGLLNNKEKKEELVKLAKEVAEIERQMQEKVYPLRGATHAFDGFSIHNLEGKFYPTKDYETGEIKYGTTIIVPEFSMKQGDTVLISGESGTGKSTFLRFLKRGDINNRSKIELDNGEQVDYFGKEYISFRPSIDLGNETSVFSQITGKNSVYDLSEEEREHLLQIMMQLKLGKEDILEELERKKFMQFSTGQQRRLALSKVFYRINDGTSVVIVDEPVGNVEDSLIREQLEIIKKYAEEKKLMLILVTHRIDLAKDLVSKRYHISHDGRMEEIPVTQREERND